MEDTRHIRRTFLVGLALAMGGSILFSAKAIVVKLAYRYGVDAATLIALRMVIAAPFFAVAFVWSSRGKPPLLWKDHGKLIFVGLTGYHAASYLDFLGLQYITAGLERLILYLNPTLVVLISAVFLGRSLSRIDVFALMLAYGGIVLVFWHDVTMEGTEASLGAALVFASAVSYAVYLVVSGELIGRLGAIRLTSYAMLAAMGGVVVQFAWLNPLAALAQPIPVYGLSVVNALLCTVIPVFATMLAVERVGASNTSMAAMIGPVSTIVLAWIFLGESVSLWQLAGTCLVLSGIYVLTRKAGL